MLSDDEGISPWQYIYLRVIVQTDVCKPTKYYSDITTSATVSNQRRLDCLLNRLSRPTPNKIVPRH